MKIINIFLLALLFTSKTLFTMEERRPEITFQHIPEEPYATIAQQGIIAIIEESNDAITATEKVTEFLKTMRLPAGSFNAQLTQQHILKNLIATFKSALKAKFTSDLAHLSQQELNSQLQDKANYSVLKLLNIHKSKNINAFDKLINNLANLIIAGANPNLVTYLSIGFGTVDIFLFLSMIVEFSEFHKLIPLLLIYEADINGKEIEYGKYTNSFMDSSTKVLIRKPILEAIRQPKEHAIKIINLFTDYNIDLNASDVYGDIPYYIQQYNKDLAPLFEKK